MLSVSTALIIWLTYFGIGLAVMGVWLVKRRIRLREGQTQEWLGPMLLSVVPLNIIVFVLTIAFWPVWVIVYFTSRWYCNQGDNHPKRGDNG